MYNTLVEDRKIVTAHGFKARVIRLLDEVPFRLADVVLTDTLHHGKYFESALGVPRERIHRVFVGAGKPFQQARWHPAEGPFTVLFYAKFSPLHGVLTILDAARKLQGEEVCFTIVGGGQLEADVRKEVHELELPNLEWIEWLDTAVLVERMRQCHVNLGIVGATTKAEMVIPNKVFQALAMGVPVITRESPAIRELLDHGPSGVLCEADDGAELARAILQCKHDQDSLEMIGRNGREAFLQRASHPAIARQFFEAVHAR